jgi:hypothetical protein
MLPCGTAYSAVSSQNEYVGISRFWVGQGILLLTGFLGSLALKSSDLFSIAIFISYIWSIFWSYIDAESRGKSGCAVALLIMLLSWVGILIWIIFRP